MKKLIICLLCLLLFLSPVFAEKDTASEEYLKSKHHAAFMNPFAEHIAQRVIKKLLKKETGGTYKVKFDGYTFSSMKKGVFKYLEIRGKNIVSSNIDIPYIKLFTLSDYNRIDYKQSPVQFKSDMTFAYNLHLSEKSLNQALENSDYKKVIRRVNNKLYPIIVVYNVKVRIRHDKLYLIVEYNLPLFQQKKNKTLQISSRLKIDNGKIYANNIGIDNAYGSLPIDKLSKLVNMLDPTSFTLDLIDNKKCDGNITNVSIEDNIVKIDGRIFIKGE